MAKHLILVVDDEVPILRLVRAKLQADGYSVMTAGSGQEALAALEQERPDLVVLDLMMPGMDGFETMQGIRKDSKVPIILLTARSGAPYKIQGLDLGADDYVTKPFNPDEFSSRIAAILRRTTGASKPENQVLRYPQVTIWRSGASRSPSRRYISAGRSESCGTSSPAIPDGSCSMPSC